MDTVLTLLHTLDSMSAWHPVAFALGVILIMVTEGLLMVGIFTIIQKSLGTSGKRTR